MSTALDVIVVGCGYAGRLLAQRISASGIRTVGLSRRVQTEFQNFSHLQTDLDNLHCAPEIDCEGKVVYYLVPPPKSGSVDTRLGNFLDCIVTGVPAKFIPLLNSWFSTICFKTVDKGGILAIRLTKMAGVS